ncbi:hypothetical protein CMI41_00070 [Candidatus Pacearchaeota archaeon]|mgnify:CR=1 FL=1|nr:hypothetical protein [Candidatus Pacearchaeota archaeon]|tara:strand:+ start:842 stop:1351 length:510 start_codon:yes stop_codon:yes gene_type:complete
MKIYLVRHGESKANAKGIHQGQKIDTSLSKKGLEQAKKIAERLKDKTFEIIYSSDLKRAYETAKEISKFHNLKIVKDKRLREKADKEDNQDLIERTKDFMKDVKKHKGNVLVVAHGGINRFILGISTGDRKKGAELGRKLIQSNACLSILEKTNQDYEIHFFDCTKHLN